MEKTENFGPLLKNFKISSIFGKISEIKMPTPFDPPDRFSKFFMYCGSAITGELMIKFLSFGRLPKKKKKF